MVCTFPCLFPPSPFVEVWLILTATGLTLSYLPSFLKKLCLSSVIPEDNSVVVNMLLGTIQFPPLLNLIFLFLNFLKNEWVASLLKHNH